MADWQMPEEITSLALDLTWKCLPVVTAPVKNAHSVPTSVDLAAKDSPRQAASQATGDG